MVTIYTDIEIQASIRRIWEVITDFDNYYKWNPFIKKIEGKLSLGQSLTLHVKSNQKGKLKSYKNIIINSLKPEQELIWQWKILLKTLCFEEHCFHLTPIDDNKTLFVNRDEMTGIIPFFQKRMIIRNSTNTFIEINQALKKYIEN